MRFRRSCLTMLEHVLVLSAYLFFIGIYGLITSQNMVRALMCLELILNAVNMNFVTFSNFFDNRQLKGEILSIFVIAIAAAEAAIGPAIVSAIYRNRKSTRINESNLLRYNKNRLNQSILALSTKAIQK
uniref:NAD(P)H-quinone oxidoreductase subunit 4L, chloroplastic n=1 Tax=Kuepferia damyonensis TaxID=1499126 RepID=A0A8F4XDP3_9GENT|nr:NADH-plastoquinone oxidoreductase subunit 4L [Kuepferia damyonensis]